MSARWPWASYCGNCFKPVAFTDRRTTERRRDRQAADGSSAAANNDGHNPEAVAPVHAHGFLTYPELLIRQHDHSRPFGYGVLTINGSLLQLLMRLVLPSIITSIHKSNEFGLFVGLKEL